MTSRQWSDVFKRLKDIQVFEIDFSGGEIFLREDIFDILAAAVNLTFPRITIVTNGTLITDAVARSLRDLKPSNIAVSLDGDREIHDQIRGEGSFDRTMNGIGHLIQNGMRPSIQYTPLKTNIQTLEKLIAVLYPLGIRRLSFNNLHPSGRARQIYRDIRLDCFQDAQSFQGMIDRIRNEYTGIDIGNSFLSYQCYPDMYRNLSRPGEKAARTLKPCSAAHTSCTITAGGWVIPCAELFDFCGGNIKDKDILDIWRHSENFKQIRDLSAIPLSQVPHCQHCPYNIFCNAGCRADAFTIYGDLLAPDPLCPY